MEVRRLAVRSVRLVRSNQHPCATGEGDGSSSLAGRSLDSGYGSGAKRNPPAIDTVCRSTPEWIMTCLSVWSAIVRQATHPIATVDSFPRHARPPSAPRLAVELNSRSEPNYEPGGRGATTWPGHMRALDGGGGPVPESRKNRQCLSTTNATSNGRRFVVKIAFGPGPIAAQPATIFDDGIQRPQHAPPYTQVLVFNAGVSDFRILACPLYCSGRTADADNAGEGHWSRPPSSHSDHWNLRRPIVHERK